MNGSRRYRPNDGQPVRPEGHHPCVPPVRSERGVKKRHRFVPRYSNGRGGIQTHTSSVIQGISRVNVQVGEGRYERSSSGADRSAEPGCSGRGGRRWVASIVARARLQGCCSAASS